MVRGMGFSKPKAVTPEPAPPPVTTTSADVSRAEDAEKRKQQQRHGYAKTLLTTPAQAPLGGVPEKKTLLG